MKPVLIKTVLSSFLFCLFLPTHAQSLPMAPQHAGTWLYGAGMGSSLIFNNKEANLFRANGVTAKMFGRYFWGKWGLAATTGLSAGSISRDGIHQFTTDRGIAPGSVQIASSNPQNGYLLFGPSIRVGNKIFVSADAQAGLFLNNPGMVNIAQQGVDRPLYRFEATDKNLFPGFAGSVSFHYPVGKSTRFYINADYMQTQSQINLLDLKNGIDVATKVSRDVKWMQAGVGIVKSFGRQRDKRAIADEPLAYMGNDTHKNQNNNAAPCGPVHITHTLSDGSSETIQFACPADALAYQNAQQPQGSVPMDNTGYSSRYAFGNNEDKANYFVYGRLSYVAGNLPGIVTNQTFNEKAASISTAAFWIKDNGNTTNARRRTYAPIIVRNIAEEPCKDCIASVVANPIYESNGHNGANPLYDGSKKFAAGDNGQSACSGMEGISVSLLSSVGNTVIATTKTGPCGEFFFANLPHDDYSLSFNGQLEKHIGYDVTLNTKADIAGLINEQQGSWMIEWSSNFGTDTEAAGIVKNMTIAMPSKTATDNGQGNLMLQSMVVNIWSPRSNFSLEELENGSANFQKRTTGSNGKSIRVAAGKKGTEQAVEVNTDGNGAFEIAGLQKGTYFVKAAIPIVIAKKVKVDIKTWGDPHEGPEHFKSINNSKGWDGSVKGNSFTDGEQQRKGWDGSVKGNSFAEGEQQRKGWDGSVKGNSKLEAQDFNTTRSNKDNRIVINPGGNGTLSAQDFNTTRSNKDNRIITNNNNNTNSAAPAQLAGQDFNTTRSNKDNRLVSVSVDADMDGDGIFETDVSSKISDVIILDSNWIEKTPAALKKIHNRNSITEIGNGLYLSFGTATINGKEVRVQSVLKTRYDRQRNSIGNVR